MSAENWYAAKCVFRFEALPNVGTDPVYEERIILLQARSFDEAVELAEKSASEYADGQCEYLGYVSIYHLFETPGHGREVYSLMRHSTLDADEYLNRFYDTGAELHRNLP